MRHNKRTHDPFSLTGALTTSREALRLLEGNDCAPARRMAAKALNQARRAAGIPSRGVFNYGVASPMQQRAWESIKANVRAVKRECPVRRRK